MINSCVPHKMTQSISTNPNNTRQKPESVLIYNKKMGGVDDVDKVLKPNQSIPKSFKWYKKVYFHLFDHTVYNSFIAYKLLHPGSKHRFKVFLETLVKEILQEFPTAPARVGRPSTATITDNRLIGSHYPFQTESQNRITKGQCKFCSLEKTRKRSSFKCDNCKEWLCVKGHPSYFRKYHTLLNLPNST
jgi:hypothetical protein